MRLDFSLRAHHHTPATGLIRVAHPTDTIYISAGGEVRGLDISHQPLGVNITVVNIGHAGIDHLAQIVRRHVGGHTHGDARGTVDQQVRYTGRHHGRFLQCIVKIVGEIHRLLVEVLHHLLAYLLQAGLRITHGRGTVTVHRAEVTLTVHQRIAHGPVLSHTDQGAIYGRVTMRMIFTKHLTYNSRGFLIRFVRRVSKLHHSVKNTPVDRLETITHIREGARNDYRHRVIDVRRLHFLFDVDFYNSVLFLFLHLNNVINCTYSSFVKNHAKVRLLPDIQKLFIQKIHKSRPADTSWNPFSKLWHTFC